MITSDGGERQILVIDDDEGITTSISRLLEDKYTVYSANSGYEGLRRVNELHPNLVLLDLKLPDIGGMEVLEKLKELDNCISVIVMTAYGRVEEAVCSIRLGAADFIIKPFDDKKLRGNIEKLFSLKTLCLTDLEVRKNIIGESQAIHGVWNAIERFAPSDVTILLEGETGTGKELFARAIHEISKQRDDPFCAVDCSSLPETLLESEIFGYEKGAFTGATERRYGRFELAKGGTLFLDEVSNFSPSTQAKLLRVIQERKFYPLGSKTSKPVNLDCRIVAATNKNLRDAVQKGIFRDDLLYRLNAITIEIPSLKERKEDIGLLTLHFIKLYNEKFDKNISGISPQILTIFENYPWSGNVRELENVIRYSVLSAVDTIMPWHLPEYLRDTFNYPVTTSAGETSRTDKEIIITVELRCNPEEGMDLKKLSAKAQEEAEKRLILEAMKRTDLNQSKLAKLLGIDRKTLRARLKDAG